MNGLPLAYYLPILSTLITIVFATKIYQRYAARGHSGNHLLWWFLGVIAYGLGTFSESYITLFGLNGFIFKTWYVVGALLGGAPLAQGTVWLLLSKKTARLLTYALILAVVVSSGFVISSPLNYELMAGSGNLPSGIFFEWQWVRMFSPFINTYAVIFLVGGAILSAWRFYQSSKIDTPAAVLARDRFIGNALIAVGAILPALGGAASRFGHTEYLYMGEFAGIILIWLGYWFNIRKRPVNKPEADKADSVG